MPNPTDADLEGAAYSAATLNRNDPNYDASLHEVAQKVEDVSRVVSAVNIIDGQEQVIALRLTEKNNRALATETARTLGDLFEAPVTRIKVNRDPSDTPDTARYRQAPSHTHYREDRKRVPDRFTE